MMRLAEEAGAVAMAGFVLGGRAGRGRPPREGKVEPLGVSHSRLRGRTPREG